MTQRVALATVMDRISIDAVITDYAAAVDDGAWDDLGALFTPDGRADYRGAGGPEGPATEAVRWLSESLRPFPARQHLIVNRCLELQDLGGYPGDLAQVRADYLSPMGPETGDGGSVPTVVTGGRYVFDLRRTEAGWRLLSLSALRKWRYAPGAATAG
ncbi:nuclear transport factor 2 family protein [Streptomyces sp. NPDC047737]|uniref:nuclear transport factor 2 family protein n=1 Tax=unclassified Streptomyces TaxID=2593676 RepID=UPI0033F9BBD9